MKIIQAGSADMGGCCTHYLDPNRGSPTSWTHALMTNPAKHDACIGNACSVSTRGDVVPMRDSTCLGHHPSRRT